MIGLKSLASLKASVIVAFILLWNVGCWTAFQLNGGMGQLVTNDAVILMVGVCSAAFIFAACIGLSKRVQNIVVAPARRQNFRSVDFMLVAAVFALLVIMTAVSGVA